MWEKWTTVQTQKVWDIPRFLHGYNKINLIQPGTHENYHGQVTGQHRPNMTETMTKPKDKIRYSIRTERNQDKKLYGRKVPEKWKK